MRALWTHPFFIAALASAAALVAADAAQAQTETQARARRGESAGATLTLPADQRLLELRVEGAQQARVGERFKYQIHVRNLSDNIVLHDVKIAQERAEGFSIESSQVQGGEQAQQGQETQQGQRQQSQQERQRQQREGQQQREQQREQQQREQQQREQQQREQQQREQQQGQQERQQREGQQREGQQQQARQQQEQGQQSQGGQDENGRTVWTIDKLEPGQSRLISVEAASDQEGRAMMCLAVVSYTPTLCFATEFVQPDLELVKRVPEYAGLCDQIEFEYFVTNRGTGEARSFTIQDDLGEGIQTVSGQPRLRFQVDGLRPGDTRKFVARLRPTRAGEFASRAVAVQGEETLARSREERVTVREADLAVAIEGPRAEVVNKPMHYTIRVTNRGEATAPNVQLTLHHAQDAALVRAGEPQRSNRAVGQSQASRGSPTPAERGQGRDAQQQRQRQQEAQQREGQSQSAQQRQRQQEEQRRQQQEAQQQEEQQQEEQQQEEQQEEEQQEEEQQNSCQDQQDVEERDAERQQEQQRERQQEQQRERQQQDAQQRERANQQQAEGQRQRGQGQARQGQQQRAQEARAQERDIEMATRTWELGDLEPGETRAVTVILRSRKGGVFPNRAVAEFICGVDQDRQQAKVSSVAMQRTEVIALPALLVSVVDDEDPIEAGQEVTYQIVVVNQGDSPDHNVQIIAEAPEGTEVVSADGQTDGKVSGREVTFEPVEKLDPGDRIVWRVRVKGDIDRQVVFRTTLDSDGLTEPAQSEEPTRFFRR